MYQMRHWIAKGPLSSSGAHGEVTSIIPEVAGVGGGEGGKWEQGELQKKMDLIEKLNTSLCLIIRKAQKFRPSPSFSMTLVGEIFLLHLFPKIKFIFQERVWLIQSSHLSPNLKNGYNFLKHTLAKQ